MKKLLILVLILLPSVYAQDITITLSKDIYYQHETLQADVIINLSLAEKITASNFVLIDKNNKTIPVTLFLEEISNNHYFVYFDIPKLEKDNYYFLVKDVKYLDNILKKTSRSKEFYLDNVTSISIYSAIFNRLNSTILRITNYNNPINITLTADEINLSKTFLLEKIFNIALDLPKNIDNFNIRIDYGDRFYLIPVITYKEIIIKETKDKEPLIYTQPPSNSLILLNSSFGNYFKDKIILTKNSFAEGPFYVKNTWAYAINNIEFKLTRNLNEIARLNLTFIPEIKSEEILTQYIWVNENQNPSKLKYSGNIEVKPEQGNLILLPLEVIFSEEKIENNITKEEKIDLNKTFFNQTKQETITKEEKTDKNIIIATIILVLILLSIFIYFLFKKSSKKKDFEEFLKEK